MLVGFIHLLNWQYNETFYLQIFFQVSDEMTYIWSTVIMVVCVTVLAKTALWRHQSRRLNFLDLRRNVGKIRRTCLTSHISCSVWRPRGSKLLRTMPLKRVGSCGIILSFNLRSFRPMEHISSPSIRILPLAGSIRRNRELIRVVFPLPVLPTTPILFPAAKVQVIPFRTKGAFGRYFTWIINSTC